MVSFAVSRTEPQWSAAPWHVRTSSHLPITPAPGRTRAGAVPGPRTWRRWSSSTGPAFRAPGVVARGRGGRRWGAGVAHHRHRARRGDRRRQRADPRGATGLPRVDRRRSRLAPAGTRAGAAAPGGGPRTRGIGTMARARGGQREPRRGRAVPTGGFAVSRRFWEDGRWRQEMLAASEVRVGCQLGLVVTGASGSRLAAAFAEQAAERPDVGALHFVLSDGAGSSSPRSWARNARPRTASPTVWR